MCVNRRSAQEYSQYFSFFAIFSLIWISAVLVPFSSAQNTSGRPVSPRHLQPINSARFLKKDAGSDPSAVTIMQNALASSGGLPAWHTLRSAKSQYNSTGPQGTTISVLLLDDWTSANVRYRRGVVHGNVPPIDHDSHATFPVGSGTHKQDVQEFDQARVLADHLPSAAIEVMLRSNSYVFKQLSADQCSSGNLCVSVYRQTTPNGPFLNEQEWEFSASTGLPASVKLLLPDIIHHSTDIWEQISFADYETNGSCLVPQTLTAVLPGGRAQIRKLAFLQPGAPFDAQAFDQELQHD